MSRATLQPKLRNITKTFLYRDFSVVMKNKLISWKRILFFFFFSHSGQNDGKARPTPQSFFFVKLFSHLADSQPQLPATKIKLYLLLYLCINISFELEAAIADFVLPSG